MPNSYKALYGLAADTAWQNEASEPEGPDYQLQPSINKCIYSSSQLSVLSAWDWSPEFLYAVESWSSRTPLCLFRSCIHLHPDVWGRLGHPLPHLLLASACLAAWFDSLHLKATSGSPCCIINVHSHCSGKRQMWLQTWGPKRRLVCSGQSLQHAIKGCVKRGHFCRVSLALTMQQVRGWVLATESGSGSGTAQEAGSSHLFYCLAPERDHCLLWLKGSNHFT